MTGDRMRLSFMLPFCVCLLACNSEQQPKDKAKKESFQKLDLESLEKAAEDVVLVPPPLELQQEFDKAGIKSDLSSLITPKPPDNA